MDLSITSYNNSYPQLTLTKTEILPASSRTGPSRLTIGFRNKAIAVTIATFLAFVIRQISHGDGCPLINVTSNGSVKPVTTLMDNVNGLPMVISSIDMFGIPHFSELTSPQVDIGSLERLAGIMTIGGV